MPDSIRFDSPSLKTRATPKQARARQRVGHILSAAVDVLADHPPGDLSATLVAERAQVPVSSVYRYFPTVSDLAEELYLHAAADLKDAITGAIDRPGGWRGRIAAVLDLLRGFVIDHPYYRPLLVFIAAQRGPQTLEHDFNTELVAMLAQRWRAGGDGFAGGDPQVVAATAVQIVLSLEELMVRQGDTGREALYFDEMTRAVTLYLAEFLSDTSTGDHA